MVWWNDALDTWAWGPRGGASDMVRFIGISFPGEDEPEGESVSVVIVREGTRWWPIPPPPLPPEMDGLEGMEGLGRSIDGMEGLDECGTDSGADGAGTDVADMPDVEAEADEEEVGTALIMR